MNYTKENKLLDRLKYGRVFLFLGFDYFVDIYSFNPVLKLISEDLGQDINSYEDLFKHGNSISAENRFKKIKHDIDSIPTNNILDKISLVKWNAVYTSSVDDLVLNRLKNEGRITKPICNNSKVSTYSRSELCIFYLFGLYSRHDTSEKVPSSRIESIKRKHESQLMLNTLIDSMSPLDTVIISGWNPKTDPVSSESLYQIISKLPQEQAYIFGGTEAFRDELVNNLIEEKKLVKSDGLLSDFIYQNENYFLNSNEHSDDLDSFIRINNNPLEIPTRIRRVLNNYGQIVEDKFFNSIEGKVEKEYLFKDFLFESSRAPVWSAYPLKLDFEREYFASLYNLVIDELKRNKVSESPVILHGATGTGKSIALARLCYALYNLNRYLVIHINNKIDTLNFKVIDEACEWAESSAGLITVICWDGMSSIDAYQNLSSYLSSRGRKQLIIGTTYKNITYKSRRFINAPEQFTDKENNEFPKYLNINSIPFDTKPAKFDSTFLVTLYRLIPETRFSITSGVVNEANHIKQLLSKNMTMIDSCENIISEAFRKAFENKKSVLSSYLYNENEVSINNIVDIVMIFGKFGIETPLDVIIRVHPMLRFSNLSDAFENVDIIRWSENKSGDINLSARNTLEAEIYCKRITPNIRFHVEKLLSVINCIEQKVLYKSTEINFCSEIVKAFGPNGLYGKEYQDFYFDISRAIGGLLSLKKIDSPRLMLHQANLLREYGRNKYNDTSIYYPEYYEILQEALAVIEKAIQSEEKKELPSNRQFSYTLIALYGEKASILGTLANQCSNDNREENFISSLINEAIDTLKESFKYNISNYISLDSIAWIAMNNLKSSTSLEADKLKFLLDAISIFNEYNIEDLEERYRTVFLNRKASLYEKIGDEFVSKQTLEQLKSISIEDYHYYQITKIISGINIFSDYNDADNNSLDNALKYINKHKIECSSSYKISVLHLRLFWFLENKAPMLKGERVIIKKDENFWEEIFNLTQKIQSLAYNNNVIVYSYLKAVALFHLGRYKDSEILFKNLSRDSDSISGSRRVFKSFLMANEKGIRKFSGEVVSLNIPRNRGEIYIDEINTKITLFPSDFNLSSEDRGIQLNDFHIAFNFINPVADNEKYYKGYL
ncbi:hypothetical protein ABRQ01_02790 [Pectobacterium aroidearum]|uniref:P-loop NTPase n=1 Tax=Pectobacterium aroidearum TaxID=1201031 RepID=UPI0032EF2349